MNNYAIKMLILDDEPFMLKLLARMLEKLGYTSVVTSDNGQAALEVVASAQDCPNLILLDLNMPNMDGLEFVRHLVGKQYAGSLILISGEDERMQQAAENLARAHKIVVLGHLHKPATPDGLNALIAKWAPATQSMSSIAQKSYSADELREAIAKGELVNYYQPKVMIKTGRVVGVEALTRWLHPQDGVVLPELFISVAEKNGLINELTRVVLSSALTKAKLWQDAGLLMHMAVNLSMDNLTSLDFIDLIDGLVTQAGVPPQMVDFEVTETRLMEDLRIPLEILSRLRLKRFRIAIDDFGTGNSSLAQLRDFPFDELKIDHSFVHSAVSNEKLRKIFDSSLDLAKELKMVVVVEGVENLADWDFVRTRGCDIAQGFFIAKPMPAADIPAWVKSWQQSFQQLSRRA